MQTRLWKSSPMPKSASLYSLSAQSDSRERHQIGSFALQPAKALDKLQGKRLVVPATFATPARVTNDLEQVKLLATRFEKELGDEKESGTKHIEERYPEEESDAITVRSFLLLSCHIGADPRGNTCRTSRS